MVAAELRRDCTRRTKNGLRRRASEGKISTHAPFGYSIEDGRLVIDEPKAEVVAQMFARVVRGERVGDVVKWLNESNSLSPRGKGWRHDTSIYLLKNRVYAGEFVSFHTPRRRAGGGARIPRIRKKKWSSLARQSLAWSFLKQLKTDSLSIVDGVQRQENGSTCSRV